MSNEVGGACNLGETITVPSAEWRITAKHLSYDIDINGVKICEDGRVEYSGTPDEATAAFMVALGEFNQSLPGKLKAAEAEIDRLRKLLEVAKQGKPNWKDAPKKAKWLAMDSDGKWTWFRNKPEIMFGQWNASGGLWHGSDPAKWRETLEPRPEANGET